MKKEKQVALKTMAMKAKVANFIRTTLYKKRIDQISVVEKTMIFDTIFKMNTEMHNELNAYKQKRQDKAQRDLLREARGWKPKIKSPNTKINLVDSK